MIDTHAHLDACDDVAAVVGRARHAGVTRIVSIGTGIDSSAATLALADAHESVFAVIGIDPHQAGGDEAGRVDELRPLLAHRKAVAVGETGLDDHHRLATPEEQRRLFRAQLALADELGKPVVIHSRAASRATADELERFGGTVVLHCFSEPDLLPVALDRGYYLSFAGNVTFPKAGELREAAARVPAERILAETDSPYLAPQPLRGQVNEPANVVHTLAVLAEARGVTPDDLATVIDENATRAFGLPG